MDASQRATLHEARATAFALLSMLHCEPERDAWVADEVGPRLARALAEFAPNAAVHAERLGRLSEAASEPSLSVEHARIFIGPFALPAPPYGSVYLDSGEGVQGASTADVESIYAEFGFQIDGGVHEPSDHIVFELEFAAKLHQQTAVAIRDGRKAEAAALESGIERFLGQFVRPWVPEFCRRIRAAQPEAIYLSLADCLESAICGGLA